MDRHTFWMVCYANVLAMQYHPGAKVRLSPQEVAAVADQSVREFDNYLSRQQEGVCPH